MILELYIRQVRHRKFPRFRLDNANETESVIPQSFSIRHWCKVWVCTNGPVRVSPWYHNSLPHFCAMGEIVFIIFLIFLISCRLNNPEPHHNPWPPACSILYHFPILQLPIHCHIHCQNQIDPMTTLTIPPRYILISTYDIRRREYLCAILIKMSNKVFNKFPPMSLKLVLSPLTYSWWLHRICLHRISNRCLFMRVFPKAGADL